MSEIISRHLISLQIKPLKATEEGLSQIIVFKEGEKYYLAGWEQLGKKFLEILAEVEENYYRPVEMLLEIKEGDEEEAEIVGELLAQIGD